MEEHRIDIDGLTTRYLTTGDDGPPLVLLHGVGDNALDWRWVMPTLARSHRVYAPDLPGSRGSAKPEDADYSPGFFARFVASFMDALGIERAPAPPRGRWGAPGSSSPAPGARPASG